MKNNKCTGLDVAKEFTGLLGNTITVKYLSDKLFLIKQGSNKLLIESSNKKGPFSNTITLSIFDSKLKEWKSIVTLDTPPIEGRELLDHSSFDNIIELIDEMF